MFRLAASPKDLLAPGAEPAILQLLKGFDIEVKLNTWKMLSDVLMNIL
jgi:hypothetical protein